MKKNLFKFFRDSR